MLANIVEYLDANKGKKEKEATKENNEDEENENVEKPLTNEDIE